MKELWELIRPNGVIAKKTALTIVLAQAGVAILIWAAWPSKLIPGPKEVLGAFGPLWNEQGLGVELMASFKTNLEAIAIASVLSLGLAYLSVLPIMRPVILALSKCRFLGLVGLTFLFTLWTGGGHALKVSLMVFGTSVFYLTGMAAVVANIKQEEYDHAYTLRMSRWRAVWEVVIRGRLDQAFETMRQNAAIAWMMLTMVEGLVRSEGGVGALLLNENKHMVLSSVFAIQIMILALGLFQDYGIGLTKNLICPWAKLGLGRS